MGQTAHALNSRISVLSVPRLPFRMKEPLTETEREAYRNALVSGHAIRRVNGVKEFAGRAPVLRSIIEDSLYHDSREKAQALLGEVHGMKALAEFLGFLVEQAPIWGGAVYREKLRAIIMERLECDTVALKALGFFAKDRSALHNFHMIAMSSEVRDVAWSMHSALWPMTGDGQAASGT